MILSASSGFSKNSEALCYPLTETRTQIRTTSHVKIASIFSELAAPWLDAGDDEDSRRC